MGINIRFAYLVTEYLWWTTRRIYVEAHSKPLRVTRMSYVIQGPAWVLLNPGSLPDFQSHPLAFPLTLFISVLDLWALVLLFKYFQVRNVFPQKSLAQGYKQAVLRILNVTHELVELRVHPDPPGTRVLISTRNSCKSFPMVYSYTHALIRGLLTERQSFLFKRRGHTISMLEETRSMGPSQIRPQVRGILPTVPSEGKKISPCTHFRLRRSHRDTPCWIYLQMRQPFVWFLDEIRHSTGFQFLLGKIHSKYREYFPQGLLVAFPYKASC